MNFAKTRLRGPFLVFCVGFLLLAVLGWAFEVGLGWLLLLSVLAGVGALFTVVLEIYRRTGHL